MISGGHNLIKAQLFGDEHKYAAEVDRGFIISIASIVAATDHFAAVFKDSVIQIDPLASIPIQNGKVSRLHTLGNEEAYDHGTIQCSIAPIRTLACAHSRDKFHTLRQVAGQAICIKLLKRARAVNRTVESDLIALR